MTRAQGLFLAAFVLLVTLVSSATLWQQNNRLHDTAHASCLSRNDNIARATTLYKGLIAIERDNPVAARTTIDRRIALYQSAIPKPSDCT